MQGDNSWYNHAVKELDNLKERMIRFKNEPEKLKGIYGESFNAEKELELLKKRVESLKSSNKPQYSSEHTTILKKYSQQPKTIKKLFGKEPTIVTDRKGNTWYEFDIPDKFKKGKGEIKAFGLAPLVGAGVTGVLGSQYLPNPQEQVEYRNGGQLPKAQVGNGEYTVQAGNTFDGIANLKGVPKDLLRKANPDIDYNNIKVGQVINIPDAPKTKEERMEFSSSRKREDLTENILSANKLENYLAESRGNTPEFWKATADTIAYHESGPWQRMDPKAIQRSQDKDTGEIFQGPGEGLFQIETDRAGGSNSFSTFKNRYANIAEALGMDADPEIMNAKRPIDLPAEKQYTLFYSNLIESPDVKLKDYVDGKLSLEDLWLKGHKIKETKGDRENFQESVQNARKKGIPFTQIGEETSDLEMYKNYINGLYDGTEMEAAAKRLYDKLNRVYYRKAKGLGMSVPNYIMTNIINRTN